MQVRDKRYIADLTDVSFEAFQRNESRPWHDVGCINNLHLQVLQTHCQTLGSEASNSGKGSRSFRFKYKVPQGSLQKSDECPICIKRELDYKDHETHTPMFFTAIQKHIIEDFTANKDILLIPYKIYIFVNDQELSKRKAIKLPSVYKGSLLGLLVVILPTKHKGGNLIVHNGDTKEEFEFTSESYANPAIGWVAFKAYSEYEVLPVTEGTCTLLTYCIRRVEVKRDETKICVFCKKYPPKEETRLENNLKEGIEDIAKEFTRNLKFHIDDYGWRTDKIGVFLQNQYPMRKLEPEALKGIDRLIYQEFEDSDILLTPVLCCSGGIVLNKKLIELEKVMFHEHTVYSFTMEDLDRLNDTKSREMKPAEDIDFYGWRNDAEVLLNDFSIDENLHMMEPGKSFRWYYRSAMIITKRTEKKTKRKNAKKKLSEDNRKTKESLIENGRKAGDKEMSSRAEKPERSQKNMTENSEFKELSTRTDKAEKSRMNRTEILEEDMASSSDRAERFERNTAENPTEVDVASGAEGAEENRKNTRENPEVKDATVKDVTSVIRLENDGEQSDEIAAFIGDFKIESDEHASKNDDKFEECRWCEKSADELGEPLRTCSQCHEVKYCSRKCQKCHWKAEHKYTCGRYAMELD